MVRAAAHTIPRKWGLSKRIVHGRGAFRLVWEGLPNREIANRLSVCEHSVRDHLKNVTRKMHVLSRAEIIAALRWSLIQCG